MVEEDEGLLVKARLNLKIDEDLKNWAHAYAKRSGTTVTQIICAYFRHLRQEEQKVLNEELVEQI
jgi:antitoxin component of RelBE/YafQ-DinJ toxin-antitoxin module